MALNEGQGIWVESFRPSCPHSPANRTDHLLVGPAADSGLVIRRQVHRHLPHRLCLLADATRSLSPGDCRKSWRVALQLRMALEAVKDPIDEVSTPLDRGLHVTRGWCAPTPPPQCTCARHEQE